VTQTAAECVSALHNGDNLIVGITDMLAEGTYVSSEGVTLDEILLPWKAGEPGGEDCVVLEPTSELSTTACTGNDWTVPALCQYVGDNLALNKRVWMNAFEPTNNFLPSHGNDGNVYSIIGSPHTGGSEDSFPNTTWTVDLGTTCQVTSVVYVSRENCCPERNQATEIRVGSDPTNFDDSNSVVCVALPDQFIDEGYARQYHCDVPSTGRFVQVKRTDNIVMDFADLAVQGNCLDVLKLPCDYHHYNYRG